MAAYEYSTLRKSYGNFLRPIAVVSVDGNELRGAKGGLAVSNLIVDLTCGYEASQATFDIENCYDLEKSQFNFSILKKYILLGSPVVISTGYNLVVREVFRGVICKCDFVIEEGVIPHVTVTAMDVKAIMMANHYHKQLLSEKYSDAVEEIFDQSIYMELQNNEVITDIQVSDTGESALGSVMGDIPGGDAVGGIAGDAIGSARDAAVNMAQDAASGAVSSAVSGGVNAAAGAVDAATGGVAGTVAQTADEAMKTTKQVAQTVKKAKQTERQAKQAMAQAKRTALASGTPSVPTNGADSDVSIEMVGESDYEFVVRAAKKFGFEFFVSAGDVVFRKAKSDQVELMELTNETQIKSMNVSYDITGIVESVEVRGLDVGKGKVVKQKYKNTNKISQGSKAKSLISGSSYVYVDPTVRSKSDAEGRATYLLDNMSYRYGSLELVMHGLPEMIPGRFIRISNFGSAVSNQFYVQSVQHRMLSDGSYEMKVTGKTAKMEAALPGL